MAIFTMKNDEATVSITEHASEIVSFKDVKTNGSLTPKNNKIFIKC